jgi:hypothetical protein
VREGEPEMMIVNRGQAAGRRNRHGYHQRPTVDGPRPTAGGRQQTRLVYTRKPDDRVSGREAEIRGSGARERVQMGPSGQRLAVGRG